MSSETAETEVLEGELITTDVADATAALMALNKSEIDQQIATAKRWPRSLKNFKQNALEMACLDEETAATMFYVLPRAGKKIEGPSARLAEVVGSSWGNLRYGARIVAQDKKFVTAQGACFDLEKNIAATVEVKRRITDKSGRTYGDDMIQTTSNAACSIALRQAIFKVVPFGLVKPIYEQAKLTSLGKADSMQARRSRAMEWFVKAGATQEQVLRALDRAGLDDVTMDDLVTLTGMRTAIKDGDSTIEEAFGPPIDPKGKVRKSDLNETVGKNGSPKADPLASIDVVLSKCKTLKEVGEFEEFQTAEPALNDDQRAIVREKCEAARQAIRAARGEKSNTAAEQSEPGTPDGKLFPKHQQVGQ